MKQLNLYWLGGGGGSSVPDGRTVTPINDVTLLQQCAGISNPTYTKLSEILADTGILQTILSNQNAVNYLVRSKSFAKSEALVPTMTSNTTPSGECIGSSVSSSTYDYYKAFDGDNSTFWAPSTGNMPQTIGYKSASAICVKSLKIYPYIYNGTTQSIATFQLQGSNDNNTWVDIGNVKTIDSVGEKEFTYDSNNTSYLYHQIKVLSKNVSGGCNVYSLQLYSIAEGFCDSEDAMRYIGLNNYAANTLLDDSEWCEAICNSTYFERVLNAKIPVMTSNTTPSGVASAYTAVNGYPAFRAMDGSSSNYWCSNGNTPQWLRYEFEEAVLVVKCYLKSFYYNSASYIAAYKIQGSNDGSAWDDLYSETYPNSNVARTLNFVNRTKYKYYQIYISSSYGGPGGATTLQFYGRKDV